MTAICLTAAKRYDGVAAIVVQFADPAMPERMAHHIQRCLKPDGALVLQGCTPQPPEYKTGGPPFAAHVHMEALVGRRP